VAIFLLLRNSPSYGLETHDHLGRLYYKTLRAKDVHRRAAVQWVQLYLTLPYGNSYGFHIGPFLCDLHHTIP
jgi:hypothetical protein